MAGGLPFDTRQWVKSLLNPPWFRVRANAGHIASGGDLIAVLAMAGGSNAFFADAVDAGFPTPPLTFAFARKNANSI